MQVGVETPSPTNLLFFSEKLAFEGGLNTAQIIGIGVGVCVFGAAIVGACLLGCRELRSKGSPNGKTGYTDCVIKKTYNGIFIPRKKCY